MKNKIHLYFCILILICCNIYNAYGINNNNNSDFQITQAFADSLNKYNNDSEDVPVYIVGTNGVTDWDLKTTIKREKFGISKECKIVISIYDVELEKSIGLAEYFEEGFPSTIALRAIIDKSIHQYKTRPEAFDNILGLQWGMELEDAIHKLQEIGLYSWVQCTNNDIMYLHKTSWNGYFFDGIVLSYLMSNKQKKYLTGISFIKSYNNAEQAKSFRDKIAYSLENKYGKEAITETIGNNKFKCYLIRGYYNTTSTFPSFTRIQLEIRTGNEHNNIYIVNLWYNGFFEAGEKIKIDNNQ
ncbi:MAG: hypothetical protein NC410_07425 [Oscillibacter sp.]|nr:hypothetical protein [Oscillibacter sp.]